MVRTKPINVLVIRSNHCKPDPRVQKVRDFLETAGYSVSTLAWNRTSEMHDKQADLENPHKFRAINLKAPYGDGLRNLIPQIMYQVALVFTLFSKYRKMDVMHACNLDTGLAAYIFSRITRKKFVYDCFDFYAESFPVPNFLKPTVKRLEIHLMNKADLVVIASEERVEQISGVQPRILTVLPNVPPVNIETKAPVSNELLTLGYIGTLSENRFLRETLQIVERNEKYALKIGGFGELDEDIRGSADRCDRVTFLGRVDYEVGLDIVATCDILFAMYDPTIPNHRYSAPNKYYEAAMLGKPIIVAKGTSIDDLVLKNQSGYVAGYSLESFSSVLEDIMANREDAMRKGMQARKTFEKEYTIEVTRRAFINSYQKIFTKLDVA